MPFLRLDESAFSCLVVNTMCFLEHQYSLHNSVTKGEIFADLNERSIIVWSFDGKAQQNSIWNYITPDQHHLYILDSYGLP